MITIRLMGGLGNQLFQFAFGRALQSRGTRVIFDRSHVDGNNRPYRLDVFNTHVGFGHPSGPTIFEPSLRFSPGMLELREGTLIGYWQCERYFKSIEDSLRDELTPRYGYSRAARTYAQKILDSHDRNCFVHVRRGDYLHLTHFHGMPGLDYYNTAIRQICHDDPNLRVFVFSDDPSWCREQFLGPGFTIIDGTSDWEDLSLMALCRHAVLANSSFSWWGCWLGGRDDRTVICPKRWFVTDQADGTDIPCDWWKRQ